VFQQDGFVFKKGSGSHWVGVKPSIARPIVIPEYDEIGLDIIRSNMRTAGMDRNGISNSLGTARQRPSPDRAAVR
jgi:hypothetical protein